MSDPSFRVRRGIGGHHSQRATTDVWLTPRWILDALGVFDLDPCAAPEPRPWPTATLHYASGGLVLPWHGRVWGNPPYGSAIGAWLARMAEHDHGTALIFARTETQAFTQHVWARSSGLLFLRGRLTFLGPDGLPRINPRTGRIQNAGAPSVLCAYGQHDLDVLASCGLEGHLVPLRLPRGVLVAAMPQTWRAVLVGLLERRGPVALDELYRLVASHPKVRSNPHWRDKVRQVLQRGPFSSRHRGVWELSTGSA